MVGIIDSVALSGMTSAVASVVDSGLLTSTQFNIVRGAIVGALVLGLAFLAHIAVLRRGAMAICATFMVGTAAFLEMFWLGFLPVPSNSIIVLLQGLFVGSVVIFLSASVQAARSNAALGGIMFAASLVFVGIGILNLLGRADFSVLMMRAMMGVGIFAFLLVAVQSLRGDRGARQVLPGALFGVAGVAAFLHGGGPALLPHGLFTIGVLSAGFVALTEKIRHSMSTAGAKLAPNAGNALRGGQKQKDGLPADHSGVSSQGFLDRKSSRSKDRRSLGSKKSSPDAVQAASAAFFGGGSNQNISGSSDLETSRPEPAQIAEVSARKPSLSGDRLIEVLDFSGIGVWDWSLEGVYQSQSLCRMLGADCEADFTPQAMRAFVDPGYLSLFENQVLGHGEGDGGFDIQIAIHNGYNMRVRGARASGWFRVVWKELLLFLNIYTPH